MNRLKAQQNKTQSTETNLKIYQNLTYYEGGI